MITSQATSQGVTVLDLPNEEYHARPEWSSSQVKLLPDDPWLFFRRHIEKHPAFQHKSTDSMKLGTAVHDIVLEDTPVVMIPPSGLNADGHKKGPNWKSFVEDNPGHVLCKPDDPILHMVDSIRNEPQARQWLDAEGPTEQSMIYHDDMSGLDLRARTDKIAITDDGSIVLRDIKTTTKDPYNEREIARVIYDLGYHRQAAWYWDAVQRWADQEMPGAQVRAFAFDFVRNTAPYECHVHELPGRAIELGRKQNREALSDLSGRLKTNNWKPEAFGRVAITDLPDWAYKHEDETYEQ